MSTPPSHSYRSFLVAAIDRSFWVIQTPSNALLWSSVWFPIETSDHLKTGHLRVGSNRHQIARVKSSSELPIVNRIQSRWTKVVLYASQARQWSDQSDAMDKPETTLNSEVLACPARFVPATSAPRSGVCSSIVEISGSIHRQSDGKFEVIYWVLR